jgi:hypothetical protein
VVTREKSRATEIAAAGAECRIGDPDRLGTLRGALEGVTIACWLLGTATGPENRVGALHGDRLRSFLGQAIDTTMRGFVYEAAGTVSAGTLSAGAQIARGIAEGNKIPLEVLLADPRDGVSWLAQARYAVSNLLKTDQD